LAFFDAGLPCGGDDVGDAFLLLASCFLLLASCFLAMALLEDNTLFQSNKLMTPYLLLSVHFKVVFPVNLKLDSLVP
jgi:hypothetical protein